MLNYNEIEFLSNERQAKYHAEAEARRLIQAVTVDQPTTANPLLAQIGARLVQWGRSLQGQPVALSLNTQR